MLNKSIVYFLEVARCLNFSQAAKRCFVSQQAITWHISNLESELGIKLFIRSTRSVQLTEAGVYLREQFTRIQNDLSLVVNHAQSLGISGRTISNIGIFSSFSHHKIILPIMQKLTSQWPDIYFNFQLLNLGDLLNQLLDNQLQLIITTSYTWKSWTPITSVLLHHFPFKIVIAAGHPALKNGFSASLLSELTLLTNEQPSQYNSESIMRNMPKWRQALPHRDYLHLPDINTLLLYLELKQGFALLTEELEGVFDNPNLMTFDLTGIAESLEDAGSDMICCYTKGPGNKLQKDFARAIKSIFTDNQPPEHP